MATTVQITFDCADPMLLRRFWCTALGYEMEPPPEPFTSWQEALTAWGVGPEQMNTRDACIDPEGRGPRLFFQKVPEPKRVKNRVHLDLRAAPGLRDDERMAALQARADELVAAGASIVQRHEPEGIDQGFIVMADPEGNEFCLD